MSDKTHNDKSGERIAKDKEAVVLDQRALRDFTAARTDAHGIELGPGIASANNVAKLDVALGINGQHIGARAQRRRVDVEIILRRIRDAVAPAEPARRVAP